MNGPDGDVGTRVLSIQVGNQGEEDAQKAIDDALARKRGEALAKDPETRVHNIAHTLEAQQAPASMPDNALVCTCKHPY